MATERSGSSRAQSGWWPWLRVALIAAGLLFVSETLWLWQTWPVRELLVPAASTAPQKP